MNIISGGVTAPKGFKAAGIHCGIKDNFTTPQPEKKDLAMILSAVPCAISVVPSALFLRADPKLAVLSLAVIYVVAIALTPIITHTLIGNSVNPLEVLRYILMFILIPFILTIPLKRLHLKQAPKTVFINLMMFILVFVGLGSRQEFVFSEPMVVLSLVVACIFRIFAIVGDGHPLFIFFAALIPTDLRNVIGPHVKLSLVLCVLKRTQELRRAIHRLT